MKSIKEKAEEYAKDYLFSPEPQRAPNVHFEAGANYVLKEIEQMVNSAIENKSMTIPAWRLNYIIKQLKK